MHYCLMDAAGECSPYGGFKTSKMVFAGRATPLHEIKSVLVKGAFIQQ
jgi:hypothetical protein